MWRVWQRLRAPSSHAHNFNATLQVNAQGVGGQCAGCVQFNDNRTSQSASSSASSTAHNTTTISGNNFAF